MLWGPPTRVVLAGGGHCWPPQHFDGGVKFVPCICTLYCSDSSGCNTRIKVKHQITKLLTRVLRRQRIDLAPRQDGGTILSPQSLQAYFHQFCLPDKRLQSCSDSSGCKIATSFFFLKKVSACKHLTIGNFVSERTLAVVVVVVVAVCCHAHEPKCLRSCLLGQFR